MGQPASKYLGVPYVDGGTSLETGVDCWGLVHVFMRDEAGIEIPAFPGNPHDASPDDLRAAGASHEDWFEVDGEPQRFDVAMFRHGNGLHAGVIVDHRGLVLNAVSGACGSICLDMEHDLIRRTLIGVFRHRSLA